MAAATRLDPEGAKVIFVHVAIVSERSAQDQLAQPPKSLRTLNVGDQAYVEIWAAQSDPTSLSARGLAAVYVDLRYDEKRASVIDIDSSASFSLFSDTADFAVDGVVQHTGGCATIGEQTLGSDGLWVRVSTVLLRADRPGPLGLNARPSGRPFGISIVGEFTDVDGSLIDFSSTNVTIRGKATRPAQGRTKGQ
jgi:hypothetical protein